MNVIEIQFFFIYSFFKYEKKRIPILKIDFLKGIKSKIEF